MKRKRRINRNRKEIETETETEEKQSCQRLKGYSCESELYCLVLGFFRFFFDNIYLKI